ncbi:HNH endonuclease [Photobacterium damselae]|uniref:HNH endonuclease n=1 Tax=Photobacterium damselae TaxID=38293 RepID=UPI001EFED341|nr:HNH endonuclease [Photobacterium damselae]MCG9780460.1 HNH endonuclease [Photobacterium damselae]
MARLFVTKEMKSWLTVYWPKLDIEALTVAFNRHFGVNKTPAQVKATLKNYRIKNGRKQGELTKGINREYSEEMIQFLSDHYPKAPVTNWLDTFNQTFATNKNKGAITGACKRFGIKSGRNGRFEHGHVSHNKGKSCPLRGRAKETAFGGVRSNPTSDNKKPIGSTRVCSKEGYLIIKVAEPNIWRHAHVVIWENKHGKKPKDHVIRFYDNSPEKIKAPTLDNLFMVSRSVHARLTQMKLSDIPMEHKETVILIAKIEQQIKSKELNNED